MSPDLATAMVQEFEGCRLTAYRDTRNLWTIGWGHLLQQNIDWTGHVITQELADNLLDQDLTEARSQAANFPNYYLMNDVRKAVCVSMCFQIGDKPLHCPNFIASLKAQDYDSAAENGLDSDWAKQTPSRAKLEMSMLETGNWEIPT
jgi:lysozyme